MKSTLIPSSAPTDGELVYNALRLAKVLAGRDHDVRLFFMNDSVDAVREGFDIDEIRALVDDCLAADIPIKICTTCVVRCGIGRGEMRAGTTLATMDDLTDWIEESDQVLTF